MPTRPRLVGIAATMLWSTIVFAQQVPEAAVRYGRDIRPILADRCFRCHGPDATARAAELRLDDRLTATAVREHGAAIVPGDPDHSLLLRRIAAHDDDERMPPKDSGKPPLTLAERELLTRWIAAGAEYEPHWAFVPPERPPVPAGTAPHPVDRFVEHALQQRGLTMNPPADAATLARRAFLTVTGLPPTTEELDAFVHDDAPDAYERLVDRLLDTEPYRSRGAEHLARTWLDAARYADTSGIHMDAGRQAWKWRDWLLEALRDDMPYDQFVVEQLAGDLLPDATLQQKVATGFLRNHVTTDEGGAIDEEYRVEYAAERTQTVGSVFLGLSMGCARCHDHKYDPITQRDYYSLFAFFNSNREPGLYSQVPDANRALEPFLEVPSPAQEHARQQLRDELAAAERALAEGSPEETAAFRAFAATAREGLVGAWQWLAPTSADSRHGASLSIDAAGAVCAHGENPEHDEHVVIATTTGRQARWLCVEAMTAKDLPHGKVGRAPNGNAVLQHVRLEARPAGRQAPWRTVRFVHALADVEQQDGDHAAVNLIEDDDRGWAVGAHQAPARPATALLLAEQPFADDEPCELRITLRYDSRWAQHVFGRVRFAVAPLDDATAEHLPLGTDGFHVAGPFAGNRDALYGEDHGPERALRIDPQQKFGERAWRFDARLRNARVNSELPSGSNATYVAQTVWAATARTVRMQLGSDDGFQLFVNGQRVAERKVDRAVTADSDAVDVPLRAGANFVVLKVVNTGGAGGFALRHEARPEEWAGDLRWLGLPEPFADSARSQAIAIAFRELRSPHQAARKQAVQSARERMATLEASIPRAMVMQEADAPRPTHVLVRGEYDKPDPKQPVQRAVPAAFGRLGENQPPNRLGLARWLVSEQNPLLHRVAVNRLWEFVFGTGLVRTSEDFGLQGEWPSHPELLDWLAIEFRARGQSTRSLLRLLLTSAAFRQQNVVHTAAAEADRDNRLLWRFPRRRLFAEGLRDQALFVGGLLVEQFGGRSVKPLQPQGLWQEVAMVQSNTRVYEPGTGPDLWRRSLYTYWKRACPPPSLLMLDAPTREFCTIRRSTTNTPLQALVLWNDEQFLAAARGLAARAFPAASTDDERFALMHRLCTSRSPSAHALANAHATFTSLRQRYAAAPADAAAVVGDTPLPAGADATALAPLVLMASVCLNLDSTLCVE